MAENAMQVDIPTTAAVIAALATAYANQCESHHKTPSDEAATRRKGVRILMQRGSCSRYMANRAYEALRHAGLL